MGKGVDHPENHMTQEEALGGFGPTPSMIHQWMHYKLD
jgi:hypothetical protein